MADRRRKGKPEIKIVIMSATIDPTPIARYLGSPENEVPIINVEGRTFPVERYYLEDIVADLKSLKLPDSQGGAVFRDTYVRGFLDRELPTVPRDTPLESDMDEFPMPSALIALVAARVISQSEDGHVLVFLPGWEEISAVKKMFTDHRLMGINFNDASKFEIHVLHSNVPLDAQRAIFEPVRDGERRIILSTNVAETSVTIPDVVYVIDSAKLRENRYDPVRRMSSLVTAWVGKSNLNQRAGRAGRHRPGHYYGILSKRREESLRPTQTVAMNRESLDNVVMNVKALNLPMRAHKVLGQMIDPPPKERVIAAVDSLQLSGALDKKENLTPLGRVLVQLPLDVRLAKVCVLGAVFRCFDQAVTLAAVLATRDPFMAPFDKRDEARRIKNSWVPEGFPSDTFAVMRAYRRFEKMMQEGDERERFRFVNDNFLSRTTLTSIYRFKKHVTESLDRLGVLGIIAGRTGPVMGKGGARNRWGSEIPADLKAILNQNDQSLPLQAALLAAAVTPNFAIKFSRHLFRTAKDGVSFSIKAAFFLFVDLVTDEGTGFSLSL
jgi:HrpA-like RNA helicase